MGAGLEGPSFRRQVVVLDVNHPQTLFHGPVDGLVDILNDLLVVFRDVILQGR